MNARMRALEDRLREALEALNELPRFSLRGKGERTSYDLARDIAELLTKREPGPEYTTLEVEAALCVWEDINERTLLSIAHKHPGMVAAREDWGSFGMRHASMAIGRWCLEVYEAAGGAKTFDGWAYDWEVIPAMLDLIDWSNFNADHPELPPVPEAAEKMRETARIWEEKRKERERQ